MTYRTTEPQILHDHLAALAADRRRRHCQFARWRLELGLDPRSPLRTDRRRAFRHRIFGFGAGHRAVPPTGWRLGSRRRMLTPDRRTDAGRAACADLGAIPAGATGPPHTGCRPLPGGMPSSIIYRQRDHGGVWTTERPPLLVRRARMYITWDHLPGDYADHPTPALRTTTGPNRTTPETRTDHRMSHPDHDALHHCARGPHCRTATTDDNGDRIPAQCPRTFCDPCTADITRALDQLPDLYTELGERLTTRPEHGTTERVTTSKAEPPIPIDPNIERLMTTTSELLASWEERVRAAAGLDPAPVNVSWAHRPAMVTRASALLARFAPTLIGLPAEPMRRALAVQDAPALPDDVLGVVRPAYVDAYPELSGADAGREILYLHRRAEVSTGNTTPVITLDGVPCPACDLIMLTRRPGDDQVTCAACGTPTPLEEYEQHLVCASRAASPGKSSGTDAAY